MDLLQSTCLFFLTLTGTSSKPAVLIVTLLVQINRNLATVLKSLILMIVFGNAKNVLPLQLSILDLFTSFGDFTGVLIHLFVTDNSKM